MVSDDERFHESQLKHGFVHANGVRLHYVELGQGPLIVLLHGFPEFWYAFRRQIPALARAGYRVVAPDLRGYNLSEKPRRIRDYRLPILIDDVATLIRSFGVGVAHVVGHDWGGWIAWSFAMHRPELVDRLVILNCPHPARFARGIFAPRQLVKSWYVFFFQLPLLPELVTRRKGFQALLGTFRSELVPPFEFSQQEYARYAEAFSQPGALRAMIDYYRAMSKPGAPLRPIHCPVLVLWGVLDRHLSRQLATPDRRWVPNVEVELFGKASHWLHHERAAEVNARIVEFLARPGPARAAAE